MNQAQFLTSSGLLFPVEWVKAALVLALMSTWMVIALFAYLNRHTRKPYFNLWTVSWMFYAVYLTAAIGLQETPQALFLSVARRACIGISALYMFYGSFQLAHVPRPHHELKMATGLLVLWSLAAAYFVRESLWITVPVFLLLGMAGVYTGLVYWARRRWYHSAKILSAGFICWGLNLLMFPFLEQMAGGSTISYIASAVLAVMIAIGMIVEEQVSAAEENYRALFDSAMDAVFMVDVWSLRILEANRAAQRLLKRSATELVGSAFDEVCPGLSRPTGTTEQLRKLFNNIFKRFAETPIRRGDGTETLCEGEAMLVEWQHRPVLQVNLRDLSERRKIGQQLQRAEKLSDLGRLVAGVVNQLNNPLAVAMGYAQVIALRPTVDVKTRRDLFRIRDETDRAVKIVRDLLAFVRPAELKKVTADINALVSQALALREAELRETSIELRTSLAPDLPRTKADLDRLKDVLRNLLTNAIDAMAKNTKARVLSVSTEASNGLIRIRILDSGAGISETIIRRIFDPFFTTKPVGRGPGLGLTVAQAVMQEHHGRVTVESEPGQGATFTLELPILACETAAGDAGTTPALVQGRLLLVDDEPGIVDVLKEAFGSEGWKVDGAANGKEALERVGVGTYDLIVSDLHMPDVDGQAMYTQLQLAHPQMARRVVFLTGDTVSPESRAFFEGQPNRWLAKPFNVQEVLHVADEVLRREGPLTPAAPSSVGSCT